MDGIRAFTFRGIPVTFSVWFFVLVAVLAMSAQSALGGLLWAAAVMVSILVHEFGHAFVAKAYRLGPRIVLHGWGGVCEHARAPSDKHRVFITAAGPGAQLLLAGAVQGTLLLLDQVIPRWYDEVPALEYFLDGLLWVSVVWALVNLIPMWPLDGGHLFEVFARRRFKPAQAHKTVHYVGLALAATAAIVAVAYQTYFGAILAAFIAWENWQALRTPQGTIPLHGGGGGAAPSSWESSSYGGGGGGGGLFGQGSWRPTRVVSRLMIANGALWILLASLSSSSFGADAYRALRLEPTGAVTDLQLWQVGTYMWLHDLERLGHLLGNLLGLWLIGSVLEQRWGSRAFLKFYLLTGVGAGVFSVVAGFVLPGTFDVPIVGASGSIMALVAAISMVMPETRLLLFFAIPLRAKWVIWIVLAIDTLAFLASPDSDIAWQTHLGGVLTAWLLITGNWRPTLLLDRIRLLWIRRGKRRPPRKPKLTVIPGGKDGGGKDGGGYLN